MIEGEVAQGVSEMIGKIGKQFVALDDYYSGFFCDF